MGFEQQTQEHIQSALKQPVDLGDSASAGTHTHYDSQFEAGQIARASAMAGVGNQQVRYSIEITNLRDMWWFAEVVSKTDFVPIDMRDNPSKCFIAIQFGLELGVSPMQALQNIAVIKGRPTIWGDLMRALILAHPECEDIQEDVYQDDTNGLTAKCVVKRKGRAPVIRFFSEADAKRANLWGKTGPWTQYPQRMIPMRAWGFAARDAFADALRGLITREEALDYPEKVMPTQVSQLQQPVYHPKAENIQQEHAPSHALYQSAKSMQEPATTRPTQKQLNDLKTEIEKLESEDKKVIEDRLEQLGLTSIDQLETERFQKLELRVAQMLKEAELDKRTEEIKANKSEQENIVKLTELAKNMQVQWLANYCGLQGEFQMFSEFPTEAVEKLLREWAQVKELYKVHKPINTKQLGSLMTTVQNLQLTEDFVLAFMKDYFKTELVSLSQLPISMLERLSAELPRLSQFPPITE